MIRSLALGTLGLAATLVVESMVLFGIGQLLPGDAATTILGANATPEAVTALRHQLGLDQNLAARYIGWSRGLLHGDAGTSVLSGQPVSTLLAEPLRNTCILLALAGIISVVLSLTIGWQAGRHPGGWTDRGLTAVSIVVLSVPGFVTATLLALLLAVILRWLPPASIVPSGESPFSHPEVLVLPTASLVIAGTAWTARLIRGAVGEASTAPSVEAARLAGLSETRVAVRHLLPLAAGPSAQAFAWLGTMLVGGTIVVEQVFAFPGLGGVLVSAVQAHDTAVVQAAGLIMVALATVLFGLAQAVGVMADPRRRTARA